MKYKCLIAAFLVSFTIMASATDWYVSGKGSDSNEGKTKTTAFRTLQKAEGLIQPGDNVYICDGIYTAEKSNNGAVLTINGSGRPDSWITWKACPGSHPEIRTVGWAGVQINGCYQILDGLKIVGGNDSLTLIDAIDDAKKPAPDPRYNTNGIIIDGRVMKPDQKPHHIIIRNCTVGKCPGGGIVAIETDYVTIEDCKVFENGWFMRYAGSGISTIDNWSFDDAPGYHMIIQRNYVWNNKTQVPWTVTGKLSDGNGIILDVTDVSQGQGATNPNADAAVKRSRNRADSIVRSAPVRPRRPEWKGRALVANNISAFNGGSGIHTFRTRHVDIINNTTYWNGQIVNYQELFPNNSDDVVILNNIIVPRPGGKVTSNNRNTNIRWDYNLYPVKQDVFKGANDIVADPQFIDIQHDLTRANFRLAKGSKGINTGCNVVPQATDISGKKRPKGSGRDRGAFEQ